MWRSSPVPFRSSSRCAAGRSCHGVSMSIPFASATASSRRRWYIDAALVQGSSAPSEIDRVGSGTISSGSMTRWKPSPWQRWQHPCGELKEKIRGSSSGIDVPHSRACEALARTAYACRLSTSPPVGERVLRSPTKPVGELGRGLDRLREALAHPLLHHQPVDHDRDVVLELLVELDRLVQPAQLAVDPGPRVALGPHLVEQPPVLALAPADHRRHDHEPRPLLQRRGRGR